MIWLRESSLIIHSGQEWVRLNLRADPNAGLLLESGALLLMLTAAALGLLQQEASRGLKPDVKPMHSYMLMASKLLN